jgi:hypothetical protein
MDIQMVIDTLVVSEDIIVPCELGIDKSNNIRC